MPTINPALAGKTLVKLLILLNLIGVGLHFYDSQQSLFILVVTNLLISLFIIGLDLMEKKVSERIGGLNILKDFSMIGGQQN